MNGKKRNSEKKNQIEDNEDLPEIELDFSDTDGDSFPREEEDDLFDDLSHSLGQQVSEELETDEMDTTKQIEVRHNEDKSSDMKRKKKKRKVLRVFGIIGILLLAFVLWMVATPSGRRFAYSIAAKFIDDSVDKDTKPTPELINGTPQPTKPVLPPSSDHRTEEFVTNYLIFGIEEVEGASNTDTMMIASVNTKDKSIKLTSLMRDSYVEIPGYKPNKLNSVYSKGGIDLMTHVIEETYDIDIAGSASVNFDSFENIIDILGGVDIELGQAETDYLNRTGYITNPANRNLNVGWNKMNGNQVVGYCRVRKRPTLGGANDDQGRTVRQRRVIKAIFDQYKSLSVFDMLPVMQECLGYVKTDLDAEQITDLLYNVVENGITTIDEFRLPVDNMYWDSELVGIGGLTYALVMKDFNNLTGRDINYLDENVKQFHEFIFLDEPEVTGTVATPVPSP